MTLALWECGCGWIRKSTNHDGDVVNFYANEGHDIGMMGMWVWVDFNANQPVINHTQIN